MNIFDFIGIFLLGLLVILLILAIYWYFKIKSIRKKMPEFNDLTDLNKINFDGKSIERREINNGGRRPEEEIGRIEETNGGNGGRGGEKDDRRERRERLAKEIEELERRLNS